MQIGDYTILNRLAVGGMAEIFLAHRTGPGGFAKKVVLKKMLPHLAASEEFREMFNREARLAAFLNHSNITQVYDYGFWGDTLYMVMEYVQGIDLMKLINYLSRQGLQLPVGDVIHILRSVCSGLHYAYNTEDLEGNQLGLIHRDISPQNILISTQGDVKITDFGIAKSTTFISHTMEGTIKGKLAYMSPEQFTGVEVDHRSDLYALGVVGYELLTGIKLFSETGSFITLQQNRSGEIKPLCYYNKHLEPELESIILKSIKYSSWERFQNAQEFLEELDTYCHHKNIQGNAISLYQFLKNNLAEDLQREAEEANSVIEEIGMGEVSSVSTRISSVETSVAIPATIQGSRSKIDTPVESPPIQKMPQKSKLKVYAILAGVLMISLISMFDVLTQKDEGNPHKELGRSEPKEIVQKMDTSKVVSISPQENAREVETGGSLDKTKKTKSLEEKAVNKNLENLPVNRREEKKPQRLFGKVKKKAPLVVASNKVAAPGKEEIQKENADRVKVTPPPEINPIKIIAEAQPWLTASVNGQKHDSTPVSITIQKGQPFFMSMKNNEGDFVIRLKGSFKISNQDNQDRSILVRLAVDTSPWSELRQNDRVLGATPMTMKGPLPFYKVLNFYCPIKKKEYKLNLKLITIIAKKD